MGPSLLSRVRVLPLTIAAVALAFGVHAGEVVKSATSEKVTTPKPAPKTKIPASVAPTRTEIELAEELAAKRAGNDDRKRQIELRERLLEASEKRLDAKLAEMKALEAQQGTSAGKTKSAANDQFMSLVKVYETMKPKDSARIFEKLDMTVQLAVASRMKERSMAAIMAEMSPEAARNLTMEMAAQAQLDQSPLGRSRERGYESRP
jgi:flagellar motility protein MotE (MotC chaperone)